MRDLIYALVALLLGGAVVAQWRQVRRLRRDLDDVLRQRAAARKHIKEALSAHDRPDGDGDGDQRRKRDRHLRALPAIGGLGIAGKWVADHPWPAGALAATVATLLLLPASMPWGTDEPQRPPVAAPPTWSPSTTPQPPPTAESPPLAPPETPPVSPPPVPAPVPNGAPTTGSPPASSPPPGPRPVRPPSTPPPPDGGDDGDSGDTEPGPGPSCLVRLEALDLVDLCVSDLA